MPLARIRTFDPEAIAFLAAQLASSGYQLQFVRPDEKTDQEADLEISVTRMDLPAALKQAQLQAEQLDVDISVLPGVFAEPPVPEPHFQEFEPAESIAVEPQTEQWITPYHLEAPDETANTEPAEEVNSEPTEAPQPSRSSKFREASADAVVAGIEALGTFKRASVRQLEDWKQRIAEKRAELRARQVAAGQNPVPVEKAHSRKSAGLRTRERLHVIGSRYRSFDRRYIRAAIAAAVVVTAGLVMWGVAGAGGPADPIGKSQLLNVQQQVPFGAASIAAPAPAVPVRATPAHRATQPPLSTEKPKARPVAKSRASSAHKRKGTEQDFVADDEVVVRHFGAKPVSQQAKTTTRHGVKVISEE